MLFIHTFQILALPLAVIPYTRRRLFWPFIDLTKTQYACLLVAITQYFAPTKIVLTVEDGLSMNEVVERDDNRHDRLKLPERNGKEVFTFLQLAS